MLKRQDQRIPKKTKMHYTMLVVLLNIKKYKKGTSIGIKLTSTANALHSQE